VGIAVTDPETLARIPMAPPPPVHREAREASAEMTRQTHMGLELQELQAQIHTVQEIQARPIHMAAQGIMIAPTRTAQEGIQETPRVTPLLVSSWRRLEVSSRMRAWLRRDSRSVLRLEMMNMDRPTPILMDQGETAITTISCGIAYECMMFEGWLGRISLG